MTSKPLNVSMMGIASFGRWLGRSGKSASDSTAERQAAEPDDAESQFSLGRELADGEGQAQDYVRAAQWYLKAAGQGHCVAQFNLGLMYGQGKGVRRDEATAGMWLRKAAESGHAGAQYQVGVRQHRASKSGPPPEASECRIEAFKWLELAVTQGYRGSETAREFVALGMTQGEVAEGGRRAVAFAAQARPIVAAG